MNDFLTAVFGKNTTLSIFFKKGEESNFKDYEIDEEDGAYLSWLYVTHNTQDAQNFLCANYRAVSENYFHFLRLGAQTLVEKERIDNMTTEQFKVEELNGQHDIRNRTLKVLDFLALQITT
jgi:hypothetical protein